MQHVIEIRVPEIMLTEPSVMDVDMQLHGFPSYDSIESSSFRSFYMEQKHGRQLARNLDAFDQWCLRRIHCVRKKWIHSIFASNLAKCWPIFKILSPTDLSVNFWQCCYKMSHHTSNASLHYLVKLLCSKIAMTRSCEEN